MEWQAGYVSGAILMPVAAIRRLATDFCATRGKHTAIHAQEPVAHELVQKVMTAFQVSADAARVRLLKLNFLTNQNLPPSLFG